GALSGQELRHVCSDAQSQGMGRGERTQYLPARAAAARRGGRRRIAVANAARGEIRLLKDVDAAQRGRGALSLAQVVAWFAGRAEPRRVIVAAHFPPRPPTRLSRHAASGGARVGGVGGFILAGGRGGPGGAVRRAGAAGGRNGGTGGGPARRGRWGGGGGGGVAGGGPCGIRLCWATPVVRERSH